MFLKVFSKAKTNDTEISDEVICRLVLAGNTEVFRLLVEKYQSKILNLGLSFFKNNDDADDFVQDVMVKAYTKLNTFLGKAKFSTWLMSIAYNTAINSKNKRKEYVSLAENYDCPSMTKTPEEKYLERELFEAVRESITKLPKNYRICVDLYFFYGFSYNEIEEVTKLPINTIKSNVFRAKKILKDRLDTQALNLNSDIADSYAFLFKRAFAL